MSGFIEIEEVVVVWTWRALDDASVEAAAVISITSIHEPPRSRLPSAGRKARVKTLGGMGGGDELLSGFIEIEELLVVWTWRALDDTRHGAVAVTSITSIQEGLLSRWPSEGRKVRVA